MQLDMISDVLGAYRAADRPLNNDALYAAVAQRADVPPEATERREPVGKAKQPRNIFHRSVRISRR